MKLKQHIEIGNYILDNTDDDKFKEFGLARKAYLLGCIAPDLNCVYPAHRLKTTENRFFKRLKLIANSHNSIIKSFTLGVITHYICDYFCYAHNIESLGLPHKKYETNLYNYYEKHCDELCSASSDWLLNIWSDNKEKSIDKCVDKSNDSLIMTTEIQCNLILEQVKLMNKEYLTECYSRVDWINKKEQMNMDLTYTLFMAEHIVNMILEPFRCLISTY
jgi:hypothetical protein